jgi:hypothetical protein
MSSLVFMATAALLSFSMATAADEAEAQQTPPAVSTVPETQPKAQEETAAQEGKTAKPAEEPACDQ